MKRSAARYVPLGLLLALACLAAVLVVKANRQAHLNAALVKAVNAQSDSRVGVLLAEGADANTRDETGHPPPPWYWGILHTLRIRKKPVPPSYLGPTVLMIACDDGNVAIVRALLAHGADVNRAGADPDHPKYFPSCLPLDEAVAGRYLLEEFLLDSSSTPKIVVMREKMQCIQITAMLLDRGAAVNSPCYDETTHKPQSALAGAVTAYGSAAVALLLQRGANPNYGMDDMPPLVEAASFGYPALVKALLNHKADPDARDNDGETALFYPGAQSLGTDDNHTNDLMIKMLLAHGANVNAQDHTGDTALMMDAAWGAYAQAKLLIDAGANVNIKNDDGGTALSQVDLKGQGMDRGTSYRKSLSYIRAYPERDVAMIKLLRKAGAKE